MTGLIGLPCAVAGILVMVLALFLLWALPRRFRATADARQGLSSSPTEVDLRWRS